MSDQEIAAFQATLLEILAKGEGRSQLQASADCVPFLEYIATFEDSMIEVAIALIQQWGKQ
jgi:hypothetical protein